MENATYDVVILGSGPAGIQAAIHASRKKARTLMLGRSENSSLYWAHVENFCCMLKVSGADILATGKMQAEQFGTEFRDEDVLSINRQGELFSLDLESGSAIVTRTLIIATGTYRNMLGVPGEKELLGRGVSYCVDCDAGFFRNEVVAVVGNRSAAVGGAVALTSFASQVHLVCDSLDVAPELSALARTSGVIIHEQRKVTQIEGINEVSAILLDDSTRVEVSGVFIELGAKGVLELTAGLGLFLDENMRYIDTDKKMRTNVPGVFAAGDICGPPLQMAKAVGEGCVAGIEAAAHARQMAQDEARE